MTKDDGPHHPQNFPRTREAVKKLSASTFLHNFVTAGIASSIAVTAMAPVERIKLILQIQGIVTNPNHKPFLNARDALSRIVKEQGVLSLWRGNWASIIRCFPYQALNFAFKDKYQTIIMNQVSEDNVPGKIFASIFSGGIGGCTALTIVYPLDLARTRMALDFARSGRDVGTLRSTIAKSWASGGIKGLYRGYPFSTIGVFLYRSCYFGVYDTGKVLSPQHHRSIFVSFLHAECAASISGFISYPFDTVRRTMMMQSGPRVSSSTSSPPNSQNATNGSFSNSFECIRTIYEKKGVRGFYHGAAINVLRGSGGAIMLVLYDKLQEFMWGRKDNFAHDSNSSSVIFSDSDHMDVEERILGDSDESESESNQRPIHQNSGNDVQDVPKNSWECLCRETAGLCEF